MLRTAHAPVEANEEVRVADVRVERDDKARLRVHVANIHASFVVEVDLNVNIYFRYY